jgi:peptidoglycan/LPS O-acetylase OafA/YrhL
LDGEATVADARLLDRHVDGCAECRAFVAGLCHAPAPVPGGPRAVAPASATAGPPPHLAAAVTRRVVEEDRSSHPRLLRAALAVVALEIIVLALTDLVPSDDAGHDARHLGAFSLAYGIALLVPVLRPARARSVLPVAIVLAGGLVATTVVDVAQGRVPLVHEAAHLPEVVSVLLVWLLARAPLRRRRRVVARDA